MWNLKVKLSKKKFRTLPIVVYIDYDAQVHIKSFFDVYEGEKEFMKKNHLKSGIVIEMNTVVILLQLTLKSNVQTFSRNNNLLGQYYIIYMYYIIIHVLYNYIYFYNLSNSCLTNWCFLYQ